MPTQSPAGLIARHVYATRSQWNARQILNPSSQDLKPSSNLCLWSPCLSRVIKILAFLHEHSVCPFAKYPSTCTDHSKSSTLQSWSKLSMRQKPKTTTANTCICRIQSSHRNRKMSNHCRDDHIKLRNPEPWVFLHRALDPTRSLRKALSPKPEALNT